MSFKQILFSLLRRDPQLDDSWADQSKTARMEDAQRSRALVLKKAAAVFPREDIAETLRRLDQYGVDPLEGDRDRVQLALLKLSEGELDKLEYYLKMAKGDFRDVLSLAEYPLAHKVGWTEIRKMDSQTVEQLRQKDREQYLEWLNG